MGRISKSLDKLRTKCTETGTHPSGNSIADILECIAEHYAGGSGGGGMVVTLTWTTDLVYECDKTVREVADAMKAGTNVMLHYIDNEAQDEYWLNTAFNGYTDTVEGYYIDDNSVNVQVTGTISNNTWH